MEYTLNIRKILDALISRFYIVLIAFIVSLAIGIILTDSNAPDMYSASTTIYSTSYVSYRDSIEATSAIFFYADILNSRKVAERASSFISWEISPEEIMGMVTFSRPIDSAIFTISAISDNPDTAVLAVNAVANAFVQEVASAAALEGVSVLDTAYTARLYSSGSQSAMRTRAMAGAAGVSLSILVIAFIAALDKRAAFAHEVTLNGEIELIGTIPEKGV